MKLVICASVEVTPQIKEVADKLSAQGHTVDIPFFSRKILSGEFSFEEYLKTKQEKGDIVYRKKEETDLIKRYYNLIKNSDAILVLNLDKKGIDNYIGGSTFMEMGFAHVLDKKIFLFNNIPKMAYTDELEDMKPIILNGDLSKID